MCKIFSTVSLSIGDRILVHLQSTSSSNGIYIVVSSGTWVRDIDFSINDDVYYGIQVLVMSGSTYSMKTFALVTANPIILGTTSLNFEINAGLDGSSGTSGTRSKVYIDPTYAT